MPASLNSTVTEIPLQNASIDIWETKYRLKTKNGDAVDQDIDATYQRVAKALAAVEKTISLQKQYYQDFLWVLRQGAIPAGRIISNAGAEKHKPATSTINCTVSGIIEDSMDDILDKVHEAGLTLKAGCGIGYEFSTLRPKDAYVSGAGAYTSGPLSFMDIYDKMCFTVSSAGGRRGAQMATFDICHPDVIEFIRAKREDGRLRQFNLSLLITSEFIEAVKNKADWPLSFPVTEKEVKEDNLDLKDTKQIIWRDLPETAQYVNNSDGLVACRIIKTIPAQRLWDIIMSSTYDYAEPGFILIDKVNEMNNNWYCENIRATNPCGEQALPPYGSCLLGSINLTRFIDKPFTKSAKFDWDLYRKTIRIFTRMLDNVVEINGLPLEKQREEIISKRRHGMGYLGLGSTVTMLGMKYGDEKSLSFTEEITKVLAIESWKEGLSLAKEKGTAPILEKIFTVTGEMLHKRPEMLTDGYKVGDEIAGKVLHAKYSRYMQRIAEDEPKLVAELIEIGARFTHATSIAPTGCVVPETLIITNQGLQKIQDLGDIKGQQWQDVNFEVSTDHGFQTATQFFINGQVKTLKITTSNGRMIEATPNHQVKVICPKIGYVWKKLAEIKQGEVIPSLVDNYPIDLNPPKTLKVELKQDEGHYWNRGNFLSPDYLNERIAEFVGFLHANGNIKTERHIRLFHHIDYAEQAFERFSETLKTCFNIEAKLKQSEGEKYLKLKELHIHSLNLVNWLRLNDLSKQSSVNIRVPNKIMQGGRKIINAYIRGLFEGDGSIYKNAISFTSVSSEFISELQVLMQSIGVVAKKDISVKADSKGHKGDKDVYRLSVNHYMDRQRFIENIGFISNKGNIEIKSSKNQTTRQLKKPILETMGLAFNRKTRQAIRNQIAIFQDSLSNEVSFEEVVLIEEGFSQTYDLSVPENVTYTANNMVSHNTISLSLANNASNGIEPSFAHHYARNVIRQGKKSKEKVDVYSFELLAYRSLINSEAMPYSEDPAHQLPDYFIAADNVTPKQHVDIQAAAQRWIDSSISKTANVPTDYPYEDFKDIYQYAYEQGLKGCTTFRFNPEVFQGVLVKEADLENTTYQFTLEDGTKVELKGNEDVEYDGEMHSAANLFDALKEGYYGKF